MNKLLTKEAICHPVEYWTIEAYHGERDNL